MFRFASRLQQSPLLPVTLHHFLQHYFVQQHFLQHQLPLHHLPVLSGHASPARRNAKADADTQETFSENATYIRRPNVLRGARGVQAAIIMLVGTLLPSAESFAHGHVHSPLARQQFCERDGGYWWPQDGSGIANAACRAAFLDAGTFQFVQNIEYAANVADYNNSAAVRAVVKDQTLCAAGDNAKRGMNLPHRDWQKTRVTPRADGSIEVLFYAATPHNPSFWEFYLSKPGFDGATQRLSWSNLDLIGKAGNVAIERIDGRNMYRLNVPLPVGRSGDAILFTRWQRIDAGGEGFYNCSDIHIAGAVSDNWFDKGVYVRSGTSANAGDEIWLRVFDSTGRERVFEKLAVTAANQNTAVWAAELAARIRNSYSSVIQIGVRDSNGSIRYDNSNVSANKVWLSNNGDSFTLDIKAPQNNLPPAIVLSALYQTPAGSAITLTASASDPEGQPLSYEWLLPAGLSSANRTQASISIAAVTPAQTTDYALSLRVSDGSNTVTAGTTLRVLVGSASCARTDPDAVNHPAWRSGTAYSAGAKVAHLDLVWQANWWTNSDQPSLTGSVWKLLSTVELGWISGKAYSAGAEVDHQQRRWRARYWTNGEPGKDAAWADIGVAKCL